jgi:DNA-directed RNA polymerase sigma subunit (sigma70/sigma32)
VSNGYRQIEAKAIRKLWHPTRSRKLKRFIESLLGRTVSEQ